MRERSNSFHGRSKAGQSLLEACVAIGIICLVLMGFFQLAQLFLAREILGHAAARGARARAVGFNDFMVYKTVRVATIPAAGRMLDRPSGVNSPSQQRDIERGRIPLYLDAEDWRYLSAILDYTNWSSIGYSLIDLGGAQVDCRVRQNYPLESAIFKAFYSADTLPLSGSAAMDLHYPLYLYQPGAI